MLIKKHHEDKLASHRQEKIWQHVILDKEMLLRIYKKFYKLIIKKTNNFAFKVDKRFKLINH